MPTHFFLLLTSLTDLALYVKALLEKLIAEECKQCDTSQVLMVLDDVWDNGLLTARLLIQACPIQKTILITSRSENLAIDLGAQTQSLYQFEEEEGIAVLQSYLLDASSDLLKQLVEVLGGHPLAL